MVFVMFGVVGFVMFFDNVFEMCECCCVLFEMLFVVSEVKFVVEC